jgi:hypothetical protein
MKKSYVSAGVYHRRESTGRVLQFADPEATWPLHTDRAMNDDTGDWLMVTKTREQTTGCGRMRLLHLDDVSDLERWSSHQHGAMPLLWRPDSMLLPRGEPLTLSRPQARTMAPVFSRRGGSICIRYADFRFRSPGSLQQRDYLRALADVIGRAADESESLEIPPGAFIVLNNRFVLHGWAGLRTSSDSDRLLRFCGNL